MDTLFEYQAMTFNLALSPQADYNSNSYSTPINELDNMAIENKHVKAQIEAYLLASEEDGDLTLVTLRKLAKSSGVKKPEAILNKIELIRAIQLATYHEPCFRSETSPGCQKEDCNWRYECKKIVAEWHR